MQNREQSSRSAKWIARLLTIIGLCVVYYFIFSLFFDTPIERELKQSNRILEEQYRTLTARHDSVKSVLHNIMERDIEIHKIIFESEPYLSREDSIELRPADQRRQINKKSNTELGDELISRTSMLYQRIYRINAELKGMLAYAEKNRSNINQIPSIQPIDNPDFSFLAAAFGQIINPFHKTMHMHTGVDFSIPVGTAVFATADGVVSEIKMQGRTTGISVKLRHGNTYETVYANLGRVIAKLGEKVHRGDVIAFSGNTGMSFAPHLHYEVLFKGKPVNPINYFFLEVDVYNREKLIRQAASGMQSFD